MLHVGTLKVVSYRVLVLNSVTRSLPFPITTLDTVKRSYQKKLD
jgi:aspartyl-tRNA synthetase